jgi:hypothetical protein
MPGTKRLLVAFWLEKGELAMTQIDQVAAAAPRRSGRVKKAAVVQAEGERFTPLMSRAAHSFAMMRDDRPGPRMYSAICFPGWKKT